MNPPPVIQTMALAKSYRGTMALEPFDLELHSGSALALLGRNGAGKSTLVRILMGFITASSGRARVFGTDPHACRNTSVLVSVTSPRARKCPAA